MSVLDVMSCDGCGALAQNVERFCGTLMPPTEWLEIKGPATRGEAGKSRRTDAPRRHACSPACLAKLGEQLAKLPDAIQPGQTIKFPVQYFVAPEMATDRESQGVKEITLSYTFYPTEGFQQAANGAQTVAQTSGAAG